MKLVAAVSRATIRTRLIWTVVLVSSVALLTSGAAVWVLGLRSLHGEIDTRLALTRTELRRLADKGVDPATGHALAGPSQVVLAHLERSSLPPSEEELGIVDGSLRWVSAQGGEPSPQADPALLERLLALSASEESVIETVETVSGRHRVLVVPLDDGTHRAALARLVDLGAAEAELRRTMGLYACAAAVTVALVTALSWFGVARLLRPIEELRRATEAIDERDLTTRVPVRGRDDLSALAGAVNRMLDRVQRSVEAQRELLDDVGHQLRTPITVVRGHLELIDAADPDDVAQTRDLTIDELDRMGTLVAGLLEVARSSSSDFVSPAPTDVAALTTQVLDKARALGPRKWTLASSAAATALLDPTRVTEAWLELAGNAVKYSPEGSEIRLGSQTEDGSLLLRVEDQGIGIAPEDLARVRRRLTRLPEAAAMAQGTGLGLSVVENIAAAHGGRLDIASRPGRGSVFTLRLPIREPGAGNAHQDAHHESGGLP
ncbi:HAMP domain-containing sensor histidine kinase [Actinomyces israelii]|uniref:histidine kinase n=1 Tax=Actinomyces israelii TaxID=1659 RepID=A0ABT4IA55_9ACTO|nr:HAMP domain-containing sensor histidine kinase [Actinomyces israelii]MCZ0857973.1 HAMP domain-containing sensor histidine kinase [Actinomyces israelii]